MYNREWGKISSTTGLGFRDKGLGVRVLDFRGGPGGFEVGLEVG